MRKPCSLERKQYSVILGIIKAVASSVREGLVLLCSALVKSHLEYCIQSWGCQYRKDMVLLRWVQRRP